MDIHEWVWKHAERAYEARDRESYQLVALTRQAVPMIRDDPDQALELLAEGIALAERLEESWFMRFFEHWSIQALLFHKRDPNKALPMAEAAVQETTKPEYADFPQRICLREDLISSHLHRDPLGYTAEIEEAIGYMQVEIPPDCACRHCLASLQTEFLLAKKQWEAAEQAALDAIRSAWPASDYHHALAAYASLCQISYERREWTNLRHWSEAGKTFEGQDVGASSIPELLLWQAAALRRIGDASSAATEYRRVRAKTRRGTAVPSPGFFDALFAYHEADPDPRPAIAVCTLELEQLSGSGETMRECRVRLRRRSLLAQRGLPVAEEETAIRSLAASLRDPKPILMQMASEVTGGEFVA
jgi:hypothetical protein